MKKINILILVPQLLVGGTEKHVYQMCKSINRNYFKISVICTSVLNEDDVYYKKLKAISINVRFYCLSSKSPIDWIKLLLFINKEKIDIVHSFLYGKHFVDFIVYKLSNAKKYITVRRNIQHWRICKSTGILENIKNSYSNLIIANSQATMKTALDIEKINENKIIIIPNAVEREEVGVLLQENDLLQQRLGFGENDVILCNIANIKPVKNQIEIVKAIERVVHEYGIYNIKLILMGRSENYCLNEIEEFVKKNNIQEYVRYVGVEYSVKSILHISDAMILSSKAEGFPNAILESMAENTLVISSDVGGCSEVVKHKQTGYLYKSGDYNELACVICKYCSKSGNSYIVNNAKRLIEETYSIKNMINSYEKIYEKLI